METIVDRIISIEKTACDITKIVKSEKENLSNKVDEECQNAAKGLTETNENKIKVMAMEFDIKTREFGDKVENSTNQKRSLIEKTFSNNHDAWKNSILSEVLGRWADEL